RMTRTAPELTGTPSFLAAAARDDGLLRARAPSWYWSLGSTAARCCFATDSGAAASCIVALIVPRDDFSAPAAVGRTLSATATRPSATFVCLTRTPCSWSLVRPRLGAAVVAQAVLHRKPRRRTRGQTPRATPAKFRSFGGLQVHPASETLASWEQAR